MRELTSLVTATLGGKFTRRWTWLSSPLNSTTVRAREDARKAGAAFPTAGEPSKKLITEAKRTVERSWLGEVSVVVLQQALRDAEAAYRNFFACLKGARKGAKIGAPRFKSRKDNRQSIRFTANARWSITDSGRLNLPKIGAVKVKWSRNLPTALSSVTVIKDAATRRRS